MAIVANETSHVQRLAVRNAGHFVDEAGEVNLILLTQPLQTVGQERKPIEQAPHNLVLGDYLSERLSRRNGGSRWRYVGGPGSGRADRDAGRDEHAPTVG